MSLTMERNDDSQYHNCHRWMKQAPLLAFVSQLVNSISDYNIYLCPDTCLSFQFVIQTCLRAHKYITLIIMRLKMLIKFLMRPCKMLATYGGH